MATIHHQPDMKWIWYDHPSSNGYIIMILRIHGSPILIGAAVKELVKIQQSIIPNLKMIHFLDMQKWLTISDYPFYHNLKPLKHMMLSVLIGTFWWSFLYLKHSMRIPCHPSERPKHPESSTIGGSARTPYGGFHKWGYPWIILIFMGFPWIFPL